MSLLKDAQLPVLSRRRFLLLLLLLMYDQKRSRNPQYALSLHPNHVCKPIYSPLLLYPDHLQKPLCFHLYHVFHILLYSLRASCRPINGS
jgi:hypothetical protein